MTLRLPTRALVPVVVLAVLGGVVTTFIIARPTSSAGDDTSSLVPPKPAKLAPVKKPAPAKAQKRPVKTPVQPAAKPAAKPKPVQAPVVKPLVPVKPAVEPGGLPSLLSAALRRNRVVVVGLYDPDAVVDGIALAEARAGASAAGAGFLAINVFAEAQSRPLLELLGALENPSVLVYRRPDALFARIGGFADSETVAQAAANARR